MGAQLAHQTELPDMSRGVRSVLNFGVFCEGERVFYVDAKIAGSRSMTRSQ